MNFRPKLLSLFLILSIFSCKEQSSSPESSSNTTISDTVSQASPPKSEEESPTEYTPSVYRQRKVEQKKDI